MTFEEYLINKKIDAPAFRTSEPDLYEKWKGEFDQMHPNSFTLQKLYLINPIRRKYLLLPIMVTPATEKPTEVSNTTTTLKPKPIFKPKPKS